MMPMKPAAPSGNAMPPAASKPLPGSTSAIEPGVKTPHKSVDMLLQNAADGKYGPEAQMLGRKAMQEESGEGYSDDKDEAGPERSSSPFSDNDGDEDQQDAQAPPDRAAMFSRGGM